MKKLSLLLCLLMLSISLVACADKNVEENSDINLEEDKNLETIDPEKFNDIEREFYNILNSFDEVEVGTAGSSLKVVKYAGNIMCWALGSEIYDEQIVDITNYKMSLFETEDAKNEYLEKVELVDSTYKTLLKEGQEEFLKDAGCEDLPYPFTVDEKPMDRVELVMKTMGLR